jgi:hypothetical protein
MWGYRRRSVAIGLPDGEVLEEFEIAHRPEGFEQFFSRIEKHQKVRDCGREKKSKLGDVSRSRMSAVFSVAENHPCSSG